ncbi:MAG TPA: SdrD B-like domain-containing protein [Anaerolineales bacterium]|nr:SdrD B-like domain-containing protein [Anaerolineales bacterium]
MKLRLIIIAGLFMAGILLILSLPAQAAPLAQGVTYATNTPNPNGNIYYIVQPNDTCLRIEYLYSVSDAQLRQLNPKLDTNCTLSVGQQLLLGIGASSNPTPTLGPSPTPLPPTITPTPFNGTTQICVSLFNDLNGDGIHETTEPLIPGGAISVTEKSGKYSKTLPTLAGTDPLCFTVLPEGDYNISAAIPDNYNPTMALNTTLQVQAGDSAYIDFGAQSKDTTIAQPENTNNTSPILGILGGILLLAGLGLGGYALRLRRPASKLKESGLLKK